MSIETSENETQEECLHCEIMQVVGEFMEARAASGHEVNLPDITDCMVDSLAQFILEGVPPEERITMISYALERFGQALRSEETGGSRHLN